MYYCFQKIDRRAESHIKSPKWLAHKEATINLKNEEDNQCFQYAITIALNYNKIKKYVTKIEKIKQDEAGFSSHQTD